MSQRFQRHKRKVSNFSQQFTVGGDGFDAYENSLTATINVFWDQHFFTESYDILGLAGQNSFTATCIQTYSCEGAQVGSAFTITYSLTHGQLSGGQQVSNVAVTKQ